MNKRILSSLLFLLCLPLAAQETGYAVLREFKAGVLTPLCLPVDATSEQFDRLYAVGGIENGVASLYPASRVKAGDPCVVVFNTDRAGVELPDDSYDPNPRTCVLPWQGGTTRGEYRANTWTYTTDLGNTGSASQLRFSILDVQDMRFNVTLENLNVRQFLGQNHYTMSSPSVISSYNQQPVERRDIPNPVCLPIPKTDAGEVVITVTPAGERGADMVFRTAPVALFPVYNLIPQQDYTYKVVAGGEVVSQGRFRTTGRLRMIYAPSVSNIRDLGGWRTQDGRRVRYGRIYRGGELNGQHVATREDVDRLKALGITAELDLRLAARPEENVQTSAFGFSTEQGNFIYIDGDDYAGSHFDSPVTQAHLKAEFDLMLRTLRQGGALYYHCVWGADRTGYLSFFLESLLGLDPDSFFKDYELTTFSIAGLRSKAGYNDRPNYFNTYAGATLQERCMNYMRSKLYISQEDIDYFLSVMLE